MKRLQQPANLAHDSRAVIDHPLPGAMQGLDILLFDGLLRNKGNMRLTGCGADRFSVVAVILLPTHERLHILRADQLHFVSERFEFACPVECSRAGFEDDRAPINLREDLDELIAHHSALQHDVAAAVYAVELEYVLCDIDAEDLDSHCSSPSGCGLSACRAGGRAVHPIRWRQEFGGLKTDQVKRMKELEAENARLRRAVSDLTLDKMILAEAAKGNF